MVRITSVGYQQAERPSARATMSVVFNLPLSTTLLTLGFPAFWILYTLAYLFVTRNWPRDEAEGDEAP